MNDLTTTILNKMSSYSQLLRTVAKAFNGAEFYHLGRGTPPQTADMIFSRIYESDSPVDSSSRQFISERHFEKYRWIPGPELWVRYGPWLFDPQMHMNFGANPKLFVKYSERGFTAHRDDEGFLTVHTVSCIVPTAKSLNVNFLLGVINSALIDWWSVQMRKSRALLMTPPNNLSLLQRVPIQDFLRVGKRTKLAIAISSNAEELIQIYLEKEQAVTAASMKATDLEIIRKRKEIDRLVYELYGLTEEEVKVVEGREIERKEYG